MSEAGEPTSEPGRGRVELRYFLEVLALTGFAVAQPVLGSFGRSPETFVAAHASPAGIVAFALAVVLVPPLVLWAVAAGIGLAGRRARRAAQAGLVGLLVAVLVLVAARGARWPGGRATLVALAVGLGVLAAVAHRRFEVARLYLRFASVAPVIFLAIFLAFSPATNLVVPPRYEASGAAAPAGRPSVVMIVLDELPTASLLGDGNEIDPRLFPNLARLAGDSTFYRNHTSTAAFTDAAVPAILTGRYSTQPRPSRQAYDENLFTLLARSHEMNVHEAVTSLCPQSLCDRRQGGTAFGALARQARDLWSDMVRARSAGTARAAGGGAERGIDALIGERYELLDSFERSLAPAGSRPRLDFAHLILPHVPWERLPDGQRYDPRAREVGNFVGFWTSAGAVRLARQRHLLQLRYTDRVLGRILKRLRGLGRYDDDYVVVMADHGIAFQRGQSWRDVSRANQHELLWAPLFVKAPRQATGRVSDRAVQSIDVVPTLGDALDVDVPWKVDGHSLLRPPPDDPGARRYLPASEDALQAREGEVLARIDGDAGYQRVLEMGPLSAFTPDDRFALYRLTPRSELAGTPVADLPRGSPIDWTAALEDPARFDDVRPNASVVPVYITGEVERRGEAGLLDVAVAVNGVIGGWGGLVPGEKVGRFGVMVPPALLRAGRNSVEVFALDGPPGAATLRPVALRQ